jgi:hypothetical protein
MSLAAKLDEIRAAGAKRIPEVKRVIMGAANKELLESNIMDGVIKPGDRLPAFSLPNSFGETIESSELLAAGPVVLTVFRGVW